MKLYNHVISPLKVSAMRHSHAAFPRRYLLLVRPLLAIVVRIEHSNDPFELFILIILNWNFEALTVHGREPKVGTNLQQLLKGGLALLHGWVWYQVCAVLTLNRYIYAFFPDRLRAGKEVIILNGVEEQLRAECLFHHPLGCNPSHYGPIDLPGTTRGAFQSGNLALAADVL